MKKLRMNLISAFILIVTFIVIFSVNTCVIARDPNSSKGFAEYDDEMAEQETKNLIEEQEKEVRETETNNAKENNTVGNTAEASLTNETLSKIEEQNQTDAIGNINSSENLKKLESLNSIFIIIVIILVVVIILLIAKSKRKK